MSWKDEIRKTFVGRREFSLAELLTEFSVSPETDPSEFLQGLEVFEQEYGVRTALLRAVDPMAIFTRPPTIRNPIRWLFTRAAFEDSTSELNYRLKKRRRDIRRPLEHAPATVGEYVAAWFGAEVGSPVK